MSLGRELGSVTVYHIDEVALAKLVDDTGKLATCAPRTIVRSIAFLSLTLSFWGRTIGQAHHIVQLQIVKSLRDSTRYILRYADGTT